PESCNGVDDNCNGPIDEGVTNDPATCENTIAGVGSCTATYMCNGVGGWECNVDTPVLEVCDFADNNCDGAIDESFKDAEGRYVDDAHCGSCGVSCDGAIPNASATCAVTNGNPRCVVATCDSGYYQAGTTTCLAVQAQACRPCANDNDCSTPGDRCIPLAGGSFCGEDCSAGNAHGNAVGTCSDNDSYSCTAIAGGSNQCVPKSGACDCLLGDNGNTRACSETTSGVGTCFGSESCNYLAGWEGCSAQTPAAELCNGLDDNCNGPADEGVTRTPATCESTVAGVGTCTGTYFCDGTDGWQCPVQTPVAETCNFSDDDCNDGSDEDFKDAEGRYVDDEHCGTCGNSCDGAIPNATSTCSTASGSPRCQVATCADGYYKSGSFTCLSASDNRCESCETNANCPTPGDLCLTVDGAKFCGRDCSPGNLHGTNDCGEGYQCIPAGPSGELQCVPTSNSCSCLPGDDGDTRTCVRSNGLGTCFGNETCDWMSGWGGCSVTDPVEEICDGEDNDCNSIIDDLDGRGDSCAITNAEGTCAGIFDCSGAAALTCVGQTPTAETCNNADDNCNGQVDETFGTLNDSCSDGVGACRRFGFNVCNGQGDDVLCNAVSADPSTEICDNIDNDCNGQIDENAAWSDKGDPCNDGDGVCEVQGVIQCAADGQSTTCSAVAPAPEQTTEAGLCNQLDDDCDGSADEDFTDKGDLCSVGAGVCKTFGNLICAADGSDTECDAVEGSGSAETCDSLDNDCNGTTDDPFVNASGEYVTDAACGNCFTDCTTIFDKPNSYGICGTGGSSPSCVLTCCSRGDSNAACTIDADFYNLNDVPDDGCEFQLDEDAIYTSESDTASVDDGTCGFGPVGTTSNNAANHPCKTIGYAITRATGDSRSKVLVADGLYQESVTMARGVSLLGAYRSDTWERSLSGTNTTIRGNTASGNSKTIIADDIKGSVDTKIQGFLIFGEFNFESGGSSYALWIRNSNSRLKIENNFIFGGFGGVGDNGGDGGDGFDGGIGVIGQDGINPGEGSSESACLASSSTPGNQGSQGAGGSNTMCTGGQPSGGSGAGAVCPDRNSAQPTGAVGSAAGGGTAGTGGAGGVDWYTTSGSCGTFRTGGQANEGSPGANGGGGDDAGGGAGCSGSSGIIFDGEWLGESGGVGSAGTNGAGGGGGGGGGGADYRGNCNGSDSLGGSGGGGGAGGCGGIGGSGGSPGGGAFAVFITNDSNTTDVPALQGNTITRGTGGAAGAGGVAGKAGLGGDGGNGGVPTGSASSVRGPGGRGGQGGDGGHGGGGGGGCGGASYGVFAHNAGTPNYTDAIAGNVFTGGGEGGSGGQGGASTGTRGDDGADGIAANANF
ncbi:MAG: hypothetical protein ACI9MR_001914, partial [Myxococcota bacterium]